MNLATSNSPVGLAGCGDRRHGTGSPVNLPNWLPCEPFRLDGDLIRFSICPVMPFRLDLTVWALRRRSMNAVDLWDGETYRRVLAVDDKPVLVAVTQQATMLDITVTRGRPPSPGRAGRPIRIGSPARDQPGPFGVLRVHSPACALEPIGYAVSRVKTSPLGYGL